MCINRYGVGILMLLFDPKNKNNLFHPWWTQPVFPFPGLSAKLRGRGEGGRGKGGVVLNLQETIVQLQGPHSPATASTPNLGKAQCGGRWSHQTLPLQHCPSTGEVKIKTSMVGPQKSQRRITI